MTIISVFLLWMTGGLGLLIQDPPANQEAPAPVAKTTVPSTRSDDSNIQGTWCVVASKDSGRTAPPEALRDIRFVIMKDKMTMESGGRKQESAYTLDPSTSPKSIDLTTNGRTKPGIYDLQGDTLQICFSESTDKRPTAFDTQPDSVNDVVLTMKRMTPEELDDAKGDHEKIQGTWKVISAEDSGRKAPDEAIKNLKWVITKDKITYKFGEKAKELSFMLEATKKPQWIDLTEGDLTTLGIYKLEGDNLKVCFPEMPQGPKGKRSTAFESKPDSVNDILIILKREIP
jgi:uncharacterized protein (TIGR03067 family)